MNSLLSSILTLIQNQPEIWSSFQTDPVTPESEQPDTSTLYSSASSVRSEIYPDESDGVFISLTSEIKKTLITGKPFSVILSLSTPRTSGIKLGENIIFSAFVESKKNKEVRKLLGTVNSNGVVFFKGLVITEVIPNPQIVIKADKEFIKPFIQNIKIKEKLLESGGKKKKLADE
jgi:hypothetical protein